MIYLFIHLFVHVFMIAVFYSLVYFFIYIYLFFFSSFTAVYLVFVFLLHSSQLDFFLFYDREVFILSYMSIYFYFLFLHSPAVYLFFAFLLHFSQLFFHDVGVGYLDVFLAEILKTASINFVLYGQFILHAVPGCRVIEIETLTGSQCSNLKGKRRILSETQKICMHALQIVFKI